TIDAPKTVERIIGEFPASEQTAIRNRLAHSFRYIVSHRFLPRKDGHRRMAAIEILKSTMRTRDYVMNGERSGQSLHDAMKHGELEGMQLFDPVLLEISGMQQMLRNTLFWQHDKFTVPCHFLCD